MISEIRLNNFKCFKNRELIAAKSLNVFTGINGGGKSTVLQSLLLMQQSLTHNITTDKIIFNGHNVRLGSFNDIRNKAISQSENIEIGFKSIAGNDLLTIDYFLESSNNPLVGEIKSIVSKYNDMAIEMTKDDNNYDIKYKNKKYKGMLYSLLPLSFSNENGKQEINLTKTFDYERIHYISAERLGPQEYYPKQVWADFENVGRQGENAPYLFKEKYYETINKALCLGKGSETIGGQTEAWMNYIFNGAKVDVKDTDAGVVILRMLGNEEDYDELFKPINAGYGYSVVFPIIVAGLIAKKDDILIVENPELHLHPQAQSLMTNYLSMLSKNGIQVFVETHSDHILNGFRKNIKKGSISNNDINVLYFNPRNKENRVTKIEIDENAEIKNWPKGFFDQIDEDYNILLGE